MTVQFTRNSFFNQFTDKQRRNKSSLYYGVKRGGVMVKYSGLLATSCLVGLAISQNKAMAAPTGGNVVGGNANITVSGADTNIVQSSNRAAIDWQSFSVAPNESVNFTVPNGGATLNRVVGSEASLIQGTVRSNGTLYLVNPNGLVLDAGSQIMAQNFIASTSNVDPTQFMAGGKVTFEKSAANARISLKGTITAADRGIVGIFAPKVVNEGTIIANLGSVVLAGVQSSVIDFTGDGLINFELGATTGRAGENLLASNKGVINASGGHVTLTAQGAESLFNAIVENTGAINATSLTAKGGVVTLKSNLGSVKDSGTIEASGVTGGGNVLVWASENTDFTGDIKAEALANNAKSNGGAVEVSGIKYLNFNGTVSTLSHNGGKMGSLLLDPTDINIVDTVPSGNTGLSSTFIGLGSDGKTLPDADQHNLFSQTGATATSYITTTNLKNALASNNVVVDATTGTSSTATGKITVTNDIIWDGTGTLTLKAGNGGIALNANITSTHKNAAGQYARSNLVLFSNGGIVQDDNTVITINDLSLQHNMGVKHAITTLYGYTSDQYTAGQNYVFQTVSLGGSNHINSISKFESLILTSVPGNVTGSTVTIKNDGDLNITGRLIPFFDNTGAGAGAVNLVVSGHLQIAGILSTALNINLYGAAGSANDVTFNNGNYVIYSTRYGFDSNGHDMIINGQITISDAGSASDNNYLNLLGANNTSGALRFTRGSYIVFSAYKMIVHTNRFDFSQVAAGTNAVIGLSSAGAGSGQSRTEFQWVAPQQQFTGDLLVGSSSLTTAELTGMGLSATINRFDPSSYNSGFDAKRIDAVVITGAGVSTNGNIYVVNATSGALSGITSSGGSITVKRPTGSTAVSTFASDIGLYANKNISIEAPITVTNGNRLTLSAGLGQSITQTSAGVITADFLNVNYDSATRSIVSGDITANLSTVNLSAANNRVGTVIVMAGSKVNFKNDQDLTISGGFVGDGTQTGFITLDVGPTHNIILQTKFSQNWLNSFGVKTLTFKANQLKFGANTIGNAQDNRAFNTNGTDLVLNTNLAPDGLHAPSTLTLVSGNLTISNFMLVGGNLVLNNYAGESLKVTAVTGNLIVGSGTVTGVTATRYAGSTSNTDWISSSYIDHVNYSAFAADYDSHQVRATGDIYIAVGANDANLIDLRAITSSGGNVIFAAGAANNLSPTTNVTVSATAAGKGIQFLGNTKFAANNLTLNAGTGGVTGAGTLTVSNGNLSISSGGTINLTALAVSGTVGGSAVGAVTLGGTFGGLAAVTQTASGAFTISNTKSMAVVAPTRGAGITGALSYSVTGAGNSLSYSTAISNGSDNVTLSSVGNLNLAKDITTTGNVILTSTDGTISGTGEISGAAVTMTANKGLTIGANITASADLSLKSETDAITSTSMSTFTIKGKNITLTSETKLDYGATTITATGTGADGTVSLTSDSGNILGTGAISGTKVTESAYTSLAVNGAISASGGDVSLTSKSGATGITGSATITAANLSVDSANAVNLSGPGIDRQSERQSGGCGDIEGAR